MKLLDEQWERAEQDQPLVIAAIKLAVLFVLRKRAAASAAVPSGGRRVEGDAKGVT